MGLDQRDRLAERGAPRPHAVGRAHLQRDVAAGRITQQLAHVGLECSHCVKVVGTATVTGICRSVLMRRATGGSGGGHCGRAYLHAGAYRVGKTGGSVKGLFTLAFQPFSPQAGTPTQPAAAAGSRVVGPQPLSPAGGPRPGPAAQQDPILGAPAGSSPAQAGSGSSSSSVNRRRPIDVESASAG
jgi:hypothetical protein